MISFATRTCLLLLILLLCLTPHASAVLGAGDVVFDPAALIESIRQTLQMIETVDTLRKQYGHMLEMARGLPYRLAERYAPIWTPWLSAWPLSDTYQLNAAWARAAHGSMEFEEGYRKATEGLDRYGAELEEQLGPLEADRLKRRYAGTEHQDDINVHAIHTMGKIRLHSSMTEKKVTYLEEDIFSPDPALHTEIAELQKLNTSNVIAVRAMADTNKLLTASLEQDLAHSRSRREAEAQEINRHINYLRHAPQVHQGLTGTVTETLNSFRLP